MQNAVVIRVRKETRDKLHSVKNPGQTLDGIITQMIALWETQKYHPAAGYRLPAAAATGQEK